jgi:hypothetical protein
MRLFRIRSLLMKPTCLVLVFSAVCFAQAIVPVSDKTFEFHSGFWINLDRFLYEQALADPTPAAVAPESWKQQ